MGIEDVVAIVVGIGNNGYRGRCGYNSGHR